MGELDSFLSRCHDISGRGKPNKSRANRCALCRNERPFSGQTLVAVEHYSAVLHIYETDISKQRFYWKIGYSRTDRPSVRAHTGGRWSASNVGATRRKTASYVRFRATSGTCK